MPLKSGSFKKSNRKTEPDLPRCLCAAVPRVVLKSSPRLPLRSCVPAPEHVGLLLGSVGMLRPQAKCDSAQGTSLPLGSLPSASWRRQHQEFSFKRRQILSLKRISRERGYLHSLKMAFSFLALTSSLLFDLLWAGSLYLQKTLPARAVCCGFLRVDELSWSRGAQRGAGGSEIIES